LRQYAWRSPHFKATTAFTRLLPDSLILHPSCSIDWELLRTCLNSSIMPIWSIPEPFTSASNVFDRQTLLNGVRLKFLSKDVPGCRSPQNHSEWTSLQEIKTFP
jgi:hypothetical protein